VINVTPLELRGKKNKILKCRVKNNTRRLVRNANRYLQVLFYPKNKLGAINSLKDVSSLPYKGSSNCTVFSIVG